MTIDQGKLGELVGTFVAGSRRWLVYGPIRLQPTEIAKLGLLFAPVKGTRKLRVAVARMAR